MRYLETICLLLHLRKRAKALDAEHVVDGRERALLTLALSRMSDERRGKFLKFGYAVSLALLKETLAAGQKDLAEIAELRQQGGDIGELARRETLTIEAMRVAMSATDKIKDLVMELGLVAEESVEKSA